MEVTRDEVVITSRPQVPTSWNEKILLLGESYVLYSIHLSADPLVTDWGGSATLVDEVRYYALGGNQSLRTKYQSYDGGRGFYDSALQNKETPFDNLYHDVWNVFFTPAYPVAKAIKSEMDAKVSTRTEQNRTELSL